MRRTAATALAGSGAAVVAVLAALAGPSQASPRVGDWFSDLAPVNHSGSGHVDLHQHGTELTVDLSALGLDDGIHLAHIHGIRQAEAECPSLAADAPPAGDGNGLVDIGEGLASYGPVLRTLSNGTNDRGTALDWQRMFKHLDNGDGIASLGDLDQYAIVVHGVDVDGDGLATNPDALGNGAGNADNEVSMPALCGVIVAH
jgi:hypothetical protein